MIQGAVEGIAPRMSPSEFTRAYADHLALAGGEFTISIRDELKLCVACPDGTIHNVYLHNPYEDYTENLDLAEDILANFVAFTLNVVGTKGRRVDRARIMPAVVDRAWPKEISQATRDDDSGDVQGPLFDSFGRELVIVYAMDLDTRLWYLTQRDIEEAGIAREDLRDLAMSNLQRLLPQIERLDADALYVFRAGGIYESSILLLDKVRAKMQSEVKGELVVAIPTRDCLLVTGTENGDRLALLRKIARKRWEEGPYSLAPEPLVYRQGEFRALDEPLSSS